VRDRDQPPARVAAEVGDPAVVGAAVGARQLGVHQLRFPQQPDRRVEDRSRQALAVEELHPLAHVHGAEGGSAEVGLLGSGPDPAHLLRTNLAAQGALAHLPGVLHSLAHAAQGAELARTGQGGALACDLEVLVAVVADADPERAVAVARLEMLLPEIGWLEDVPIAIDDRGGLGHLSDSAGSTGGAYW
jgi:hypothetical protein